MANTPKKPGREREGSSLEPFSDEELAGFSGKELPDREVMSLLDLNVAIPVNAAVAANVLSDDSAAFAIAEQDADIDQAT